MKSLQKFLPSQDKIFLKGQIKSTHQLDNSSRRQFKTFEDTNETQRTQIDEVKSLKKKIMELNQVINMQQKQIVHLQEVNKYLQMGNISKLDLIKSQRDWKQKVNIRISQSPQSNMNLEVFQIKHLSPPEYNPEKPAVGEPVKRSSKVFKTVIHASVNEEPHKSVLRLDRDKTGDFNFIQKEETFKIDQILDLNIKDSDAQILYDNDGTILLLNQILKNEENFIDMMQNAKQQKLSFIFDKFERIFEEHKQLFQMLMRFKTLIKGAIQMTHSLFLDDALNTIKDQMIQYMMCDKATCYIYDQEKKELWSRGAKGGSQAVIRIPAGKGIAGQAAVDQELVNIKYAYLDPRFNQNPDNKNDYKTKSLLVCPIVEGDRCLGVLQCQNKNGQLNKGNFSKEDESLIKIFAEFAGVVLGNAINHNEQNIQNNKLRHIISSAIMMGKEIQQRDSLVKTAQTRIQALMSIDKAKICYVSNDDTMNFFDDQGHKQKLSFEGLMGQAIIKNEMISTNNCYQDLRFNSLIDIETYLPVIVIPITNPYNKHDVLGAMQVMFLKNISSNILNEEMRLSRMDQEILTLYASLIGEFLYISNLVPQKNLQRTDVKLKSQMTIYNVGNSKSLNNIMEEIFQNK